MNLTAPQKNTVTAQDLDALLQDSYLLVVELRQGASVQDSPDLWKRCEQLVEQVQQRLKEADVNARSIELISHAQCALLDETALNCAKGDAHADWGRYRDVNDPEREQVLAALNARVAPLGLKQVVMTQGIDRRMNPLRGLRSPLVQILIAGLLLVGAWWGLDHWLGGLIATLVPEQA
ncbi:MULTISPECIES: DotU family type IV/VI secretion system protein [unclassified Pseudomonas]|uniref:DotU family type IV/VI secretion system protein n=1 Tax=unclassified Pseudomonas TaxID=196821 RepID=UPI000C878DF7|nr:MULTISPECIES: DotU family type IV/VI secretion system protein [unclassified Pseudomonas]PMU08636.1 type IV secretion protein DotU [Pseudomonas sp. FW305-20]PMU19414.1 type IV secretion protein DotU [Pseudomonas sp. FW305-122]PMU38529.1 type IV secretion protein DotU [Pseudomonas sp. FW305-47B]PMX59402.1 type IV secretion protein DotU [Pseudomonas sp. FW305-33]PMX69408.1 type IV secretion protein DotU [Pseudomonas sp. FW305-60]